MALGELYTIREGSPGIPNRRESSQNFAHGPRDFFARRLCTSAVVVAVLALTLQQRLTFGQSERKFGTASTNVDIVDVDCSEGGDCVLLQKAQELRVEGGSGSDEYGVDVSFPIHHSHMKLEDHPSLAHRKKFYDDMIDGCRKYAGPEKAKECDRSEKDRIETNLMQPRGMVNFTTLGFQKIRAPKEMYGWLQEFWEANRPLLFEKSDEARAARCGHPINTTHGNETSIHCDSVGYIPPYVDGEDFNERWIAGDAGVNYWDMPTSFVSVEDGNLKGGGEDFLQRLWDASQDIISDWTGNRNLQPASVYGIRVYREGAVLTPHVDRDNLISSAIINIDQDLGEDGEDWPLEVYGHDGKAHNITMAPGDMVLYESHSIIHGRPFPLKGRFYANLFIHFEPVIENEIVDSEEDLRLPGYIVEGSQQADMWREAAKAKLRGSQDNQVDEVEEDEELDEEYEEGGEEDGSWNYFLHRDKESCTEGCHGPLLPAADAQRASMVGDLAVLKALTYHDASVLADRDHVGWQCLHFAVTSGQLGATEHILESEGGVDLINSLSEEDEPDSTPLGWALYYLGESHPVVDALRRRGALEEI